MGGNTGLNRLQFLFYKNRVTLFQPLIKIFSFFDLALFLLPFSDFSDYDTEFLDWSDWLSDIYDYYLDRFGLDLWEEEELKVAIFSFGPIFDSFS